MDIPDTLSPGQYVIYALVDPTDKKVYYVGQTHNPKRRLAEHMTARHHEGKKGEWLRRLNQQGQQPLMKILETVTGEKAALEKEQEWICHFVEKKMPLFNTQAQPRRKPAQPRPTPVAQECRSQTIIAGAPPIIAVRLPEGQAGATLRSLCALLDIDKGRQVARIKRSSGLSAALVLIVVDTSGGPQPTDVLHAWAVPIWASGLHTSRLPEKKQALALILQQKAFAAIEQAFVKAENDAPAQSAQSIFCP